MFRSQMAMRLISSVLLLLTLRFNREAAAAETAGWVTDY
jgi:hypothetical protein